VLKYLDELGISYEVDPNLVRGLDYYNHTAFEIMSEAEGFGAITTLCGGGRYNGLVEEIGGPETPGIGFALSIERLLAALEAENIQLVKKQEIDCFIVALGEKARDYSVRLLHQMRLAGFSAEKDYLNRKIKAQFKAADRLNAKYAAIIGDHELEANKITVKKMDTGEQTEVPLDQFLDYFKKLVE